ANLTRRPRTGSRKEFGIRLALCAGPSRLVRQLLTETLLLALTGSAAGLVIASWLGDSLRWLMPKVASPAVLEPELDTTVFLFTAGFGFAVTLLSCIGPGLRSALPHVNDTLKEGGRPSVAGLHAHRLQGPLVVCEVALAVVALVGAGLLLKSFQQARAIHPGFDPGGVALARFDLSSAGYDAQQTDAFC